MQSCGSESFVLCRSWQKKYNFQNCSIMDLSELEEHLDQIMARQNNRLIADFEGYSPNELYQLTHDPLGLKSPMQMQRLSGEDYKRIPLLNQIKYLIGMIEKSGEMKLTSNGFLPVKVVAELYEQHFLEDFNVKLGLRKVYKESDVMTINLTRILIEISGLVKKRNGKLSLTKASRKIIADDWELLRLIFMTFATKFNWAYYDGYEEDHVGQMGFGFTLLLLSHYGQKTRPDSFYAEKYFKAFPMLLEYFKPGYRTREDQARRCYSIRTFDRFLLYFGLIYIENEEEFFREASLIAKTPLFDQLFHCLPHRKV